MAPVPLLPETTHTAIVSAGLTPRSSTLPLPLPIKSLIVQCRHQPTGGLEETQSGVVTVNITAQKYVNNRGVTEGGAGSEFQKKAANALDIANPYNLLSAEKPEELLTVGETFTDTTLSFMLSGRIIAEQVSYLTHLFRQTICCDLESCVRAGRSSAPGIYAPSFSGSTPASSLSPSLGNFVAWERLLASTPKRNCRRVGVRCGVAQTSQRSPSSLSCWKLKGGKCISFKREDANARLLLSSATISTRGLALSCRRPLIIADVNEHQRVSKSSLARR